MNMVTVIVPVYNMSHYIDKCVQSVIEQTYKDFVLFLIDDGSTDDSLEKCVRWRHLDNRIVVFSKKNEGLGPTRNMGIRVSDSEYVSFLDADDWWHPDYLRMMLGGTEGGKNDIVLCDMNFVQEMPTGELKNRVSRLRFEAGELDLSAEWNLINCARTFMCGKLYRRRLFLEYGIEQPSHTYEDVATTPYLVAKAKSIYYVPHALYFYLRNRQGSIVNDFSSLNGLFQSLQELYWRFYDGDLLSKYSSSLRRLFWGQLIFTYKVLEDKFFAEENKQQEQIKSDVNHMVCNYFPELKKMLRYKFGVPSHEYLIIEALKKIVISEQAIVYDMDLSHADVLVFSGQEKQCSRGIFVMLPDEFPQDEERVIWDIADTIFDQIWNL